MRAFVLATGGRIEPFGDPVADTLIVNKRLEDTQRDNLAYAGITEVVRGATRESLPRDGFPYLVISDDLYLSRTLLKEFLAAGVASATPAARLALKDCQSVKDSKPLQELVDGPGWTGYPAWVVNTAPSLDDAQPSVIDPKDSVQTVRDVPRIFAEEGSMSLALTSRVAIRLQHWVHVLRVNHLAMLAGLAEAKERPLWKNLLPILWLLLRSFPPNEARVKRALVTRGRGVKIHPSAVVEASILGDGVKIGAHAYVHASVLAKGAHVGEGAIVDMSVLGERAVVSKHCVSNYNVLFPGAFLGYGLHQMNVFGRESFAAAYARFYDFNFAGEIKVKHQGELKTVGSRFLGCAIGHEAWIGAGLYIQHGRAIPNKTRLIRDPSQVVQKFAEVAPGTLLIARDGEAVPLKRP